MYFYSLKLVGDPRCRSNPSTNLYVNIDIPEVNVFPSRYILERLARRCRAITCSPVIGTKTGNVFHEILGYGLIYRNFSVLLLS